MRAGDFGRSIPTIRRRPEANGPKWMGNGVEQGFPLALLDDHIALQASHEGEETP